MTMIAIVPGVHRTVTLKFEIVAIGTSGGGIDDVELEPG
jgi:hypothetical protein